MKEFPVPGSLPVDWLVQGKVPNEKQHFHCKDSSHKTVGLTQGINQLGLPPLRLKSKDSPCPLIHVTLDLLVFLRGLVFRRVILIHVANVPVFKQELGGSFDLTLVRHEVEHVPLRPLALTLVSIYCRGKKALRCAYSLITVSYQEAIS